MENSELQRCKYCKTMVKPSSLNSHIWKQHESKGVFCPICNFLIPKNLLALKDHLKKKHPGKGYNEVQLREMLLANVKFKNYEEVKSVYTVSGGAFGLGKSRKH